MGSVIAALTNADNDLQAVLDCCTNTEKKKRFQALSALKTAFKGMVKSDERSSNIPKKDYTVKEAKPKKKKKKKLIAIIAAAISLCLLVGTAVFVVMKVSDGRIADIEWSYDPNTRAVYIRGEGRMPDYEKNGAPWSLICSVNYATIYVEDGITGIGANFIDSDQYIALVLSADVMEISEDAFGATPIFNIKVDSENKYLCVTV